MNKVSRLDWARTEKVSQGVGARRRQQCAANILGAKGFSLKELSHGILGYFEHRQNYCLSEGNLKIILSKDRRTPKRE